MYNRKYKPGRTIKTLNELEKALNETGWVYIRHKVQHKGWVISLQLRTVLGDLKAGSFKKVIYI